MSMLGSEAFEIAISVPLVLEYEDAALRDSAATGLEEKDVRSVIDYMCAVAHHQEIFFLWRPILRDAGDDLVLEAAVAANCEAIITHNVRDFDRAHQFGIRVLRPADFLSEVGGSR